MANTISKVLLDKILLNSEALNPNRKKIPRLRFWFLQFSSPTPTPLITGSNLLHNPPSCVAIVRQLSTWGFTLTITNSWWSKGSYQRKKLQFCGKSPFPPLNDFFPQIPAFDNAKQMLNKCGLGKTSPFLPLKLPPKRVKSKQKIKCNSFSA